MRYLVPSPAGGRRPVGPRVARSLVSAAAVVALAGCSWITGVPKVDRVRVTLGSSSIPAGSSVPIVGESFEKSGTVITHRQGIVRFTSSNPAVATVSGSGTGTVIGVSAGTAWIIGEVKGKRDSAQITVTLRPPAAIQIAPAFPRIRVGSASSVQVNPLDATGQPITGFTLACQSNSPTVLSATASGSNCALNGLNVGQAVLRVTVNGTTSADFTVVVENEAPTRVEPAVRSPLRESERVSVNVVLRRADGSIIPSAGRTFGYSSSDNAVISIDASGVLTANREGTATITVTADNVTGTQVVQVTKIPVVDLVLPQNPIFRVGATSTLNFAPLDSTLPPRTLSTAGRLLAFTVADPTVMRITGSGLVEPLKVGTTQVTVRVDSITRTTTATVTAIPVGAVDIDSNFVERNPGGTYQYRATVFDSLGRVLTDRRIVWLSNNSSIVSVNASTGLARAETPGIATIRAEVERVPGFPGTVFDEGRFTVFAAPVARVEVAPTSVTVRAGGSTLVSLIARDAAGNQLFGRTIVPTSTNPAVAVAEGSGLVRGLTPGTTTIRFQAVDSGGQPQGEAAELQVTVSSTVTAVRKPAP